MLLAILTILAILVIIVAFGLGISTTIYLPISTLVIIILVLQLIAVILCIVYIIVMIKSIMCNSLFPYRQPLDTIETTRF